MILIGLDAKRAMHVTSIISLPFIFDGCVTDANRGDLVWSNIRKLQRTTWCHRCGAMSTKKTILMHLRRKEVVVLLCKGFRRKLSGVQLGTDIHGEWEFRRISRDGYFFVSSLYQYEAIIYPRRWEYFCALGVTLYPLWLSDWRKCSGPPYVLERMYILSNQPSFLWSETAKAENGPQYTLSNGAYSSSPNLVYVFILTVPSHINVFLALLYSLILAVNVPEGCI